MASSTELRQQRAQNWARTQEILDAAEAENRDLTAEEEASYQAAHADSEALTRRIERQEEQERTAAAHKQVPGTPVQPPESRLSEDEREHQKQERSQAFDTWLRWGAGGLNPEQRAVMQSRYKPFSDEERAQSVAVDTAGGYFVFDEFRAQVESAMKWYGGMRQACYVFSTNTGAELPIPTDDDTTNEGDVIGENIQVTNQDVTVGQRRLRAYMYTSKLILVSLQLLQDSAFAIEPWLADKIGDRIGRGQNRDFTSGGGSNRPTGITIDVVSGKTAASATAIAWNELIDLEHSVDVAYRSQGKWMFHDLTLAALKKLTDGEGRYLWQPGLPQAGTPNTLNGYPYQVNNHMPTIATGVKSVVFGNLSKYYIRDVLGIQVMQLRERYADNFQVGFLGFARCDGKLIDAGTNPVKCLTQA